MRRYLNITDENSTWVLATPETLKERSKTHSPKAYISPRVSWILATPRLSAKMTLMRAATPPMATPNRDEAAAAEAKSVTRKPGKGNYDEEAWEENGENKVRALKRKGSE